MGVSGVGWVEEVVLAREVVDSEGVEMVWRGEVRILGVVWCGGGVLDIDAFG
jgi:hypothetical protein